MATLNSVLADVAAYIDQDTTLATGTELTVRVNLINQALNEWAETYQWASLRVTSPVTFALSAVSIGLATNFKKLMSPIVDRSLTSDNVYVQIRPEERYNKLSSDKYCYILGNDVIGKSLNVNPALASGASLVYDYQSTPSSMATLQDVSVCPSTDFLVKRTIARLLESRSDARFTFVKEEADSALANMMQEEATPSGGQNNRTPNWATKANFRVGA